MADEKIDYFDGIRDHFSQLDTQIIEASTDEGTIYPYGGVRITARVLYDFTRGSA